MEYTELKSKEINRKLFEHFTRHQIVNKCWRKVQEKWCLIDDPFTDEWNEEEYCELIACLKNTITTGGVVFGAFSNGMLKGFTSVEPSLFGKNKEYLDLSSIHVSEDMRGKGIGKELFLMAKTWARDHGAKKLYISAHSAEESQVFYSRMGCHEAKEYNKFHVEKEPCDCQLECSCSEIDIIKTKRLILKPYGDSDEESMIEILTNEKIKETFMIPDFKNKDEAVSMFKKLQKLSNDHNHYERGIYISEQLIGFLNDVDIKQDKIELGYVIHPKYQKMGYATEALMAAIEDLFEKGFNEIITGAFIDNIASISVMKKCGMVKIAKEEDISYHSETRHCIYYAAHKK